MNEFKGDFLGFMYGDIHSSTFNIVRVSSGDRYSNNLNAQQTDITAQVTGRDGMYFFKSTLQPIQFNFPIAFDNVSEENIEDMKRWLGKDGEYDLIFDETPYKVYKAKIQNIQSLSFICFDNSETGKRVYKGEGTLQFICYNPYAFQKFKDLKDYNELEYPTKNQWALSSRLLEDRNTGKVYDNFIGNTCNVYNPGRRKTPISFDFEVKDASGYQSINYLIEGDIKQRLILDLSKLSTGKKYKIDSKLKLILEYNGEELSNVVHNYAIAAGDFIEIEEQLDRNHSLTIAPTIDSKISFIKKEGYDIDYNYYY